MKNAACIYVAAVTAALVVLFTGPVTLLTAAAFVVYLAAHVNISRAMRANPLTSSMRRAALRGTAGARHHAAHWHGGHN